MSFGFLREVFSGWGRVGIGIGRSNFKIGLGSVLGLRGLLGPILKLERPAPTAGSRLIWRKLEMVVCYRIAVVRAGGSAVGFYPAREGAFGRGECVFANVGLVAQVARLAPDVHLIEVPVK